MGLILALGFMMTVVVFGFGYLFWTFIAKPISHKFEGTEQKAQLYLVKFKAGIGMAENIKTLRNYLSRKYKSIVVFRGDWSYEFHMYDDEVDELILRPSVDEVKMLGRQHTTTVYKSET